jgi:hypothetical protein
MDTIRRTISRYQSRWEFYRSALSALLHAVDEIYNITAAEQELNYSTLIQILRDDFAMTLFIT